MLLRVDELKLKIKLSVKSYTGAVVLWLWEIGFGRNEVTLPVYKSIDSKKNSAIVDKYRQMSI